MLTYTFNLFERYPILRYLFIGGFNTLMSLLVYYALIYFNINYLLASAVTNIFGVVEGFVLNSLIVFRHKIKWSGLFKYSSVYGLSFIISLLLMYILVDTSHVSKFIAPIINTGVITVINYYLVKRFVFKS